MIAKLLAITLAFLPISLAVHGEVVSVSRQGADLVLTWPSAPGRSYIIQKRENLNPGTPWVTLVPNFPAAPNATSTSYIGSGLIPSDSGGGSGGGGSGGPPPAPQNTSAIEDDSEDDKKAGKKKDKKKMNPFTFHHILMTRPPGMKTRTRLVFRPLL